MTSKIHSEFNWPLSSAKSRTKKLKETKKLTYCKVANSSLSRLVAHFQIFRRLIKEKFDAYVLWPLAKKLQNWIVDQSTASDFTVVTFRLSWLVALPRIFRRLMKGKFNAYVLWPLAKKFQNWIVDRSTARDITVADIWCLVFGF